jgi:nucleotide-binding universal stress UspA family protein
VKTIVAATDFSPRSVIAVNKAAAIAKLIGARLTLVRVISPQSFFGRLFSRNNVESELAESKERLAKMLADTGVQGEAIALEGAPSEVIMKTAKEQNAAFIALGDHGEFHLADLLLGATSRHTIELSDLPILVVKTDNPIPYKRALIATDFLESSAKAAKFTAETFSETELVVFNAYLTPSDIAASRYDAVTDEISSMLEAMRGEAIAKLNEFVKSLSLGDREVKTIARSSASPSDMIVETSKSERCDLLVMGTKSIESFLPMIIGSSAESALRRSEIDMLVLRQ